MATTLRPLSPDGVASGRARRRGVGILSAVPALTLLIFLAPVGAGLLGTWLPAFGWLPALGGTGFGLGPWQALLSSPELPGALGLTVTSGTLSSVCSVLIVVGFCASAHGTQLFRTIERLLAPLLAIPHAAVALGLVFLLAPSGWFARLLSPWPTEWDLFTGWVIIPDRHGLALALGLLIKEVPYLLLMTLAAAGQLEVKESLAVARSLGYGPAAAWLKAVMPRIYPQIRLPIYAIIAYSFSTVDMAMILAPATPPPLAPLLIRWFNDPELLTRFAAAAGATLQLAVVVVAILLWRVGEVLARRAGRVWIASGSRRGPLAAGHVAKVTLVALVALAASGVAANILWSFAARWRYPAVLPSEWTTATWMGHGPNLLHVLWMTTSTALAATLAALALTLGCLENEQRRGLHPSSRGLWLIYAPLLVPQISFLFGLQVLLVRLGLDGTWLGLVWSHLLFVLPYVFLSLADPFRSLDERYVRSALCLGAPPDRAFWRIKLPMLRRPVLLSVAIGMAVSIGQYLPTLFAGAGRFSTLTTEAVGLAVGADRRVIGVYALAQTLLPMLPFWLALAVPARPRIAVVGEQRS